MTIAEAIAERTNASRLAARLMLAIKGFDALVGEDRETWVRAVGIGDAAEFFPVVIGHFDPDVIYFNGLNSAGDPMRLIQHVSQVNILMTAKPKADPGKPKRVIGFDTQAAS